MIYTLFLMVVAVLGLSVSLSAAVVLAFDWWWER